MTGPPSETVCQPLRSPVVATGKTPFAAVIGRDTAYAATEPGRRDREDAAAPTEPRHSTPRRYGARSSRPGRRRLFVSTRSPARCRYGARSSRPGRLTRPAVSGPCPRCRYGARSSRPGRLLATFTGIQNKVGPLRSPVVATGKTRRPAVARGVSTVAATEPGRRDREDHGSSGITASGTAGRYGARSSRPGRRGSSGPSSSTAAAAATEPGRRDREDVERQPGKALVRVAATEPGRRDREDVSDGGHVRLMFSRPLRSPVVATGKTTSGSTASTRWSGRYGARSSRPGRPPLVPGPVPAALVAATEPGRRDREDGSPRIAASTWAFGDACERCLQLTCR